MTDRGFVGWLHGGWLAGGPAGLNLYTPATTWLSRRVAARAGKMQRPSPQARPDRAEDVGRPISWQECLLVGCVGFDWHVVGLVDRLRLLCQ